MSEPTQLDVALVALKGSPHWPVLVGAVKERRETWIRDSRITNVYQTHAELVHVTARVAELDHWLELLG